MPSSPILEVDSPVLREQVLLRGVARDLQVPGQKPVALVQTPVRMWNEPPEDLGVPHALGEDTERILRGWLQMDDARLASLRQAGAIN